MKKNHTKIELRSEKVRNIIGKVPTSLECWGIVIIIIILFILLSIILFVKYPYSNEETIFQHIFT